MMMRATWVRSSWVVGQLVLMAWLVAGCGNSTARASARPQQLPANPAAKVLPLTVVRQGPKVSAYVRVAIEGQSLLFKVDTGSARTVISSHVARALHLPERGDALTAATLGCAVRSQPVYVAEWRLGNLDLPKLAIVSQTTVDTGSKVNGTVVSGLLGSDILSRLGTVTLNFARHRLVVGGDEEPRGQVVAMRTTHNRVGGVGETVQATVNKRPGEWLIDTGAQATLLAGRAAARLGARPLGPSVVAFGAGGCSTRVAPVGIDTWSADGVALPPTAAISAPTAKLASPTGQQIDGVIGADVLGRFASVTFDFAADRLILSRPQT